MRPSRRRLSTSSMRVVHEAGSGRSRRLHTWTELGPVFSRGPGLGHPESLSLGGGYCTVLLRLPHCSILLRFRSGVSQNPDERTNTKLDEDARGSLLLRGCRAVRERVCRAWHLYTAYLALSTPRPCIKFPLHRRSPESTSATQLEPQHSNHANTLCLPRRKKNRPHFP